MSSTIFRVESFENEDGNFDGKSKKKTTKKQQQQQQKKRLGMCTQSTIESEWSSTKLFAGRMKCEQQW